MTDKLGSRFAETVPTATPQVLDVDADNPIAPTKYSRQQFQFDMTGAGTLKIETKIIGQAAFNDQGSFSGETIILDLVGVEQLQLTASTADVPTVILPYIQGQV